MLLSFYLIIVFRGIDSIIFPTIFVVSRWQVLTHERDRNEDRLAVNVQLFSWWHQQETIILLSTFQILNQSSSKQKEFLGLLQTCNLSNLWLVIFWCVYTRPRLHLQLVVTSVFFESPDYFFHSHSFIQDTLTKSFLVQGIVHSLVYKIICELILS